MPLAVNVVGNKYGLSFLLETIITSNIHQSNIHQSYYCFVERILSRYCKTLYQHLWCIWPVLLTSPLSINIPHIYNSSALNYSGIVTYCRSPGPASMNICCKRWLSKSQCGHFLATGGHWIATSDHHAVLQEPRLMETWKYQPSRSDIIIALPRYLSHIIMFIRWTSVPCCTVSGRQTSTKLHNKSNILHSYWITRHVRQFLMC